MKKLEKLILGYFAGVALVVLTLGVTITLFPDTYDFLSPRVMSAVESSLGLVAVFAALAGVTRILFANKKQNEK